MDELDEAYMNHMKKKYPDGKHEMSPETNARFNAIEKEIKEFKVVMSSGIDRVESKIDAFFLMVQEKEDKYRKLFVSNDIYVLQQKQLEEQMTENEKKIASIVQYEELLKNLKSERDSIKRRLMDLGFTALGALFIFVLGAKEGRELLQSIF